jgi:DNA-binding GntR family transcriptional regulator
MPVRNALQQLTTQGLVVTAQRVGFFVSKFSNAELQQINDTRKMFELYCIDKYFNDISKAEAKQILERIEKLSESNDKAHQVLDSRLHHMIVEASRNAFLLKQYENLNCMFSLSMGPFSAETPDIAKEEHIAILDAICSDDRERAYNCLLRHLDRVEKELTAQNLVFGGNAD